VGVRWRGEERVDTGDDSVERESRPAALESGEREGFGVGYSFESEEGRFRMMADALAGCVLAEVVLSV